MSLQEILSADVASRFPGSNAEPLVNELLARIRNGSGNATAFVNGLRAQGLGDTVAAWLHQDTSREPTLTQTERALGAEFIERVAKASDASTEATGRQLAFLLPRAVAATAEEEARAFYSGVPSRAVAWAILVVLLAALAGLYWYVAPEAVSTARRAPTAVAPATLAIPQKPAQPSKPAPVPAAVKPAPEPPAKPAELVAAKEAVPAPATAPPAGGQRGNRFAVAALEALKPGAPTGEITAALNLSVIAFGSNSAAVPKDSAEMLKRAAALLKVAPNGTRIEIAGHTDNTGEAAYNVYLSEKRAKAVRDELVRHGAKAAMLSAKGYGGAHPVASNDTREGRALNRRIEFTVLP